MKWLLKFKNEASSNDNLKKANKSSKKQSYKNSDFFSLIYFLLVFSLLIQLGLNLSINRKENSELYIYSNSNEIVLKIRGTGS